jgi:uncharacterized protein YjiS (DUF1127 family)
MNTTFTGTGLRQTTASTGHVSRLLKIVRDGFEERRKRREVRAALLNLSDRDLIDIGTTRGEIDYVASNRGADPRGCLIGRDGI